MVCLHTAFERLGWYIEENKACKTYPGDPDREKVYEYVARNPKKGTYDYDIGIQTDASEEIGIFGDFYQGSLESQLGKNLCKLKQAYSEEVVTAHAQNELGMVVGEREVDAQGNVLVEFIS